MPYILGNPGVTDSVPTAFVMNAVGTEWVTPGLLRMDAIMLYCKTVKCPKQYYQNDLFDVTIHLQMYFIDAKYRFSGLI